ncbi:GNAT family N-acetyltransferase [bacterium]|nr:MAG: GNAT family N-acetyltransferase [bacterium]
MPDARFDIRPARTGDDYEGVARLFNAYVLSLGIDLGFQDFASELASLPGKYAPPEGELLLARDSEGEPVGCVAVRPIEPEGCCEMKRLYVAPSGRGLGLGKALMNAILVEAERIGYREMRLDTLPKLVEALALYTKGGFVPIPPYYDTPLPETIFLGRRLL